MVEVTYPVPYPAPPGYHWENGGSFDGIIVPQLVPDGGLQPFGGSTILVPPGPANDSAPAGIAPHLVITFDTIGQIIYATMGHARMPFRYLWVKGINSSGDVLDGDTITFAAALCAPIDPLEEGEAFTISEGAEQIYSTLEGITPPANWDPVKQALLIAALATAVVYPGTEGQDPDPTIIVDKGIDLVSAYRGLRYIVIQGYPATSLPQLNVVWNRTNDVTPGGGGKKKKTLPPKTAVVFAPGLT